LIYYSKDYTLRLNKLVPGLIAGMLSVLFFIVCFFYVLPDQPSLDALARYQISQRGFSFSNIIIYIINEPFSILLASLFDSPIQFQVSYAFLALLMCSRILGIPLFYLGFFVLTPPGFLLAFNITPSLIAFSIVNYHLLISNRLIKSWIILGVSNHLVAALSVAGLLVKVALRASILKRFIAVLMVSVLCLILYPIISPKIAIYENSSGNKAHTLFAIFALLILAFSRRRSVRFSCFFYIFILVPAFAISTKIASRLAFGADLLILHITYLQIQIFLRRLFPKSLR
jgi:hypothetical protein